MGVWPLGRVLCPVPRRQWAKGSALVSLALRVLLARLLVGLLVALLALQHKLDPPQIACETLETLLLSALVPLLP